MLELKNVYAGYGNRPILKSISLPFAKGTLTGVIGTNGCGKSTLLKTAAGILPAEQGEILIDGETLSALKRNAVARKIAYLEQGKHTPDMTVEQMVLHGRFPYLHYPRQYTRRDRAIAHSAMECVGIASMANTPMSALSGGIRQTAYLAMALAQDTDYILLDEPTTYLDIAHQLALLNLLRRLVDEGKGIVTVLHDLPMAMQYSDHLAVINDGTLSFFGTPNTLYQTDIIATTFGVQLKKENESFYIAPL